MIVRRLVAHRITPQSPVNRWLLSSRLAAMPKRKASSIAAASDAATEPPPPPPRKLQTSSKFAASARPKPTRGRSTLTNPNLNAEVIDAPIALRASPDRAPDLGSESPLSDLPQDDEPPAKKAKPTAKASKAAPKSKRKDPQDSVSKVKIEDEAEASSPKANKATGDPEADEDALEDADPEEVKAAMTRPPPVNSDYLPLPWKGRLGYACLNTYLRYSNPPVFCSRTTRIASILEHRHELKDPSQPEHPTKNRPDKDKPVEIWRGQKFVEQLALANVRDIAKMIRWNDRYGIRFLRLSSEMFPFASHEEYGYKLSSFASEALAEAGKVIAHYGHRVTMHPGQFTQLGSPRESVIENSFRDLEFHDDLLTLLKLPEQQDRDAVLILHMGGTFGDKAATLDRFRANYAKLSDSVKRRLVLENDDMCWHVHDLLPICQELNIPMVLDFHHHNIIFDSEKIREGTKDIMDLFPVIRETWTRKGITQKMHYSEPRPAAMTPTQRRRHNPRVMTLPPCAPDMDLMIEAKDKEQAVFELMRTFKLPGYERFNDIVPFIRSDDNKLLDADGRKKEAAAERKRVKAAKNGEDPSTIIAEDAEGPMRIPEEDVGMGGPDGRVYWPPGMEEWLRPQKRVVVKKELTEAEKSFMRTAAGKRKAAEEAAALANGAEDDEQDDPTKPTEATKKAAASTKTKATTASPKKRAPPKAKAVKQEPTPTTSDDDDDADGEDPEVDYDAAPAEAPPTRPSASRRKSARATNTPRKGYVVDASDEE